MFGPHWKDLSSPMPIPPEAKPKEEVAGTEGVADLVNPAHYGEAALKGIFGQVSEDLGKVTSEVDRRAGKKKKKAPRDDDDDEPAPPPPPPQIVYKYRPGFLNLKKLVPWYMRKEAKMAAMVAGGAAAALVLARLVRR